VVSRPHPLVRIQAPKTKSTSKLRIIEEGEEMALRAIRNLGISPAGILESVEALNSQDRPATKEDVLEIKGSTEEMLTRQGMASNEIIFTKDNDLIRFERYKN